MKRGRFKGVVCTLGPSSLDLVVMEAMVLAGMTIARLNFSHDRAGGYEKHVRNIRFLEVKLRRRIYILFDLCGPKIRIGNVPGGLDAVLELVQGSRVVLCTKMKECEPGELPLLEVSPPEVLRGLGKGNKVSMDDGKIEFFVVEVIKEDSVFLLEATCKGSLKRRKGVSFPGRILPLTSLTDGDRRDIREIKECGLLRDGDYIAISFVQSADDMIELRLFLDQLGLKGVRIIPKIETRAGATKNFLAIAKLSDMVMAARGDLAVETSDEDTPAMVKRMIRICNRLGVPIIYATQVMSSMVGCPKPTRAEASDAFNAVLDGADFVMTSEETTVGEYPIEVVKKIMAVAKAAIAYRRQEKKAGRGAVQTPYDLINVARRIAIAVFQATLLAYEGKGRKAKEVLEKWWFTS